MKIMSRLGLSVLYLFTPLIDAAFGWVVGPPPTGSSRETRTFAPLVASYDTQYHVRCILCCPSYFQNTYDGSDDSFPECVAGQWGSECLSSCGKCEGGPEFCQVYDGQCVNGCASGYTGKTCTEECPQGTYGQYCTSKCGMCSSARLHCDTETGQCLAGCQPGYQRPYCVFPCPLNTWGENCGQECKCLPDCGCHHLTGRCLLCGPGSKPLNPQAVVKTGQCSNLDITIDERKEVYLIPEVLNIPYKPVLGSIGVLGFFIMTNYLWWYFVVRNPKAKPAEHPVVERDEKKEDAPKPEILYKTIQKTGDPNSLMVRGIEGNMAVLRENLKKGNLAKPTK